MIHTEMNIVGINELVKLVVSNRESVVLKGRDVVIGDVGAFGGNGDDTASIMVVSRIAVGSKRVGLRY